ncbi:Cytochrome P450 monooxygenase FUM15 [Vanrija pseudolonga]|uniref:Cytochrome P450 monooxygenase FUM15 n=1 Tax=Vanrija pseudolonga TaxID=143232 RepID=A0AAF0YGP2_9TREE|nr:Cytochrome P450 monooxygenase FUM15 [Vanrija pseudolonga]
MSILQAQFTLPANVSEFAARELRTASAALNSPAGMVGVAVLLVALSAFLFLRRPPHYPSFVNLPGPAPSHWLWGSSLEIIKGFVGQRHTEWFTKYGKNVRYTAFGTTQAMITSDLTTINYVLKNGYDFVKVPASARVLNNLLGAGLITAEGATHRRQRRVLNPAFGPVQIKNLMPEFWNKAYELDKIWAQLIASGGDPAAAGLAPNDGPTVTPPNDVDKAAQGTDGLKFETLRWFNRFALDVLGIAGMNVELGSLHNVDNELARAYKAMATQQPQITPWIMIEMLFPILRYIPTKRQTVMRTNVAIARKNSVKLLREKKAAVAKEAAGTSDPSTRERDLLSLLVRANTSPDVPADQRLSDDEVVAQVATFLVAGHETTSTTLAFLLERLAQNPEAQEKLYAEVAAVPDDRPTYDQLSALPYLENCVREVLRLDSPVIANSRVPIEDVTLPVGNPVPGRDGKLVESVQLRKGTQILFALSHVNASTELWGPDAREFNPDRHIAGPTEKVPGVYGNILSFYGGVRNCIGYRFAVTEMKAAIFVLVRHYRFEMLPSKPKIRRKWLFVQRPAVEGEEEVGPQMPLMVRLRHE